MKKLFNLQYLILLVLISGLLAGQTAMAQTGDPGAASGDGVQPEFVPDNPSCQTLGYAYGFKIDGSGDGTYLFTNDDGELTGLTPEDLSNSITISNSDGTYFDWTSTLGLDLVIVKGGPDANAYYYDPEDFGDALLHSPMKADGTAPYGISHIEVCYDYELDIEKDANTSFTRTYEWDITKDVTPAAWDLFIGDSGTSKYEITVNRTGFEDSAWKVDGNIYITNNTPFDAVITGVSDLISPDIIPSVDCGMEFPITLAAGGSLTCSYEAMLLDATVRTNTVTVTTQAGTMVGGGTATADVVFDGNTIINEVNATVDVEDVNDLSGTRNWYNLTDGQTVDYDQTFYCGSDDEIDNVATIVQTGDWDNAKVTVNCNELEVSKDAETSLTRTYEWDITKEVTHPAWNFFVGDEGTSHYTVEVDRTGYTDSDWAVSGTISVYNPAPIPATIYSLDDVIQGSGPDIFATVDCEETFPYTLPAGGTLTCTYSSDLPDAATRINIAVATLQNYDYDDELNATESGTYEFTGSADVDFTTPTTVNEVYAEVNVTDTNGQSWGPVSGYTKWEYDRTFSCEDAGENPNTATITETGDSDDAMVVVNCYDLTVTKDADTYFTRTWEWTIDKSADQDALTLATGQQFLVNYTVTVDATSTDSEWGVEGGIWITNSNPDRDAELTSVNDLISPDIDAGVTCPSLTVPAGGTLHCTYTSNLPDAGSRTNTATATLTNYSFAADGTGIASGTTDFSSDPVAVTFSDPPTTEVDECIDVTDTNVGPLGTVCATSAPYDFTYSIYVGPYFVCGYYEVPNIASFVTNDTGTPGSDDWIITIDVPCDGCTLTPGYWKTHSINGPAPYDDTWANYDPDGDGIYATFFLSGQTWYEVLWTVPSGGNAYYILAHAYIAAQLNFLNGADPSAVQTYFDQATGFLETYTPAQMGAWKGKDKDLRNQVIALADMLDQYNNGEIGPGHCTEEEMEDSGYDSFESGQTTLPADIRLESGYYLGQNIPNPFTGTTMIEFVLPEDTYVRITLYSLHGQQVTDLVHGYFDAGSHTVEWNAPADLSPGVYFYRLQTPAKTMTRKLQLLR